MSLWLRSDVAGTYTLRFQTVSGRDLTYFKLSLPEANQWTLVRLGGSMHSLGQGEAPYQERLRLHIEPADAAISTITVAHPAVLRVGNLTRKEDSGAACARLFNTNATAMD